MKKIAKLSLVAAVAVAGLSTASASSLEESIKGVDISGMVRYRYTETGVKNGLDKQENKYDIDLTSKVPVNDMLKAVVKLDVSGALGAETDHGGPGDANPGVAVEHAYFSFMYNKIVVNAGKQGIPGPLFDGQEGTGVVVLAPVGPVTLAGGYFNANELGALQYTNAAEVGLIGSFEGVNLAAWYAQVGKDIKAYSVGADANIGPVNLLAHYGSKDVGLSGNANDFQTILVKAGANIDMFEVHGGYGKNGKAGTAEVAGGIDAGVNDGFGGNIYDLTSSTDFQLFNVGAGVSPISKVNVGLDYYFGEDAADNKFSEIVAAAAYKMSKNFKISSYYSVGEMEPAGGGTSTETNKGRLELKYSF